MYGSLSVVYKGVSIVEPYLSGTWVKSPERDAREVYDNSILVTQRNRLSTRRRQRQHSRRPTKGGDDALLIPAASRTLVANVTVAALAAQTLLMHVR